jgi:iron complex outermembrane receptor protein
MLKRLLLQIITGAAGIIVCTHAHAQTDTSEVGALEKMSLKDLLNVKIVSVSKAAELLFEAPLSASVVTREDFQRNGCTSIMEALRLVPGMIVREQSNGNYDIHLRGMDNVPNAPFDLTSNTTTLVMVDNRPIYSYLMGGTFWETLPVSLHDVEKIEVVRGPAAALYGPNAVSGVINIITRQNLAKGFHFHASSRTGSLHTIINNISTGYRFNKFSVIASGGYQHRQRSQTSYFEYNRNQWLDDPDYLLSFNNVTITDVAEQFPDSRHSMKKIAGNVFAAYDLSDKVNFNLSTGIQHSLSQRVSTENGITPLSTAISDSRYTDFRARIKGFTTQVSYNSGTQVTELAPGNKYDFNTFDASVEYNYTKHKLSIKPGITYRSAKYDDSKYADALNKTGIFKGEGHLHTLLASLRAEYKLLHNKLRLVAGISASKFDHPDTTYLSYQLAVTYKLNKKHLFRVVYSEAPRSSNIFETYVDQFVAFFPIGAKKYLSYGIHGNKNLRLLTSHMIEVGYRGHIAPRVNVDVEMFNIHSKNYSNMIMQPLEVGIMQTDTIVYARLQATNLPMELEQNGITLSFTWNAKKLKVSPFATLQYTKLKNYAASMTMPGVVTGGILPDNDIYSAMGKVQELESTPRLFGGGSIAYNPTKKITVNMTAYYYTGQTYYHLSNVLFQDGIRGIDHIPGKFILNAHVMYEPVKNIQLFCTGKNILNDRSREFFRTDEVPVMFLGGIRYQLYP